MAFPTSIVEQDLAEELITRQVNFMVRTCEHCGNEVSLGAGDVLFGDRWYHARCWELLQQLETPGGAKV
jgi:hypothetical protein